MSGGFIGASFVLVVWLFEMVVDGCVMSCFILFNAALVVFERPFAGTGGLGTAGFLSVEIFCK